MTPDQQTKRLEAIELAKKNVAYQAVITLKDDWINLSAILLAEVEAREKSESTLDLISQITWMCTPMAHYGDMTALEAIEKRPDVAVEMINAAFARSGGDRRHLESELTAARERIAALEVEKSAIIHAWEESWDCTIDEEHTLMNEVLNQETSSGAQAIEALKFYSKKSNHTMGGTCTSEVDEDGGDKASASLKALGIETDK